MKRLITIISPVLPLVLLVLAGCKKDNRDINLNLNQVKTLYAPDNNKYVKLQPASSAAVVFEWEQTRAEDGGLVLYEVAFDKENGNFSTPVYKVSSDGNGVQNKLTLSHKDLNKIANYGGIAALGTGKLRWTVLASKGYNVKKADSSRVIEVTRPAGFSDIPADVYLTGDATEAGTSLSAAIKMRSTGAGIFEIYTSLKNGKFKFTDRNTGTPTSYYPEGALLKENGEATQTAGTKVYRITLDFNNAVAKFTEIKDVAFWFGMDWNTAFGDPPRAGDKPQVKYYLSYAGNGVWKAADKYLEMQDPGWGLEGRYKFRLTVNDGTADSYEFFGSKNSDNPTPNDATDLGYWQLFPVGESQWDYSFKLKTSVQKKNNDIIIYFQPDKPYRNEIITK